MLRLIQNYSVAIVIACAGGIYVDIALILWAGIPELEWAIFFVLLWTLLCSGVTATVSNLQD